MKDASLCALLQLAFPAAQLPMQDPTLLPRKRPRQARATATVETILEAAARVLGDKSLLAFNTNRVAEAAGVSVGSVYQYFPNKAALAAALIARAQTALADAVEQAVQQHQGRPLVSVLSSLVEIAIEHQFGNAVLAAALDHEEQRLPLGDVLGSAQSRMVAAVHTALDRHPDLGAAPVPLPVAVDCLTLAKALIEAEAAQPQPDVVALRQRLLHALQGYLHMSCAAGAAAGRAQPGPGRTQ
jgi:AcrR family transcriptional regulator